MKKEYAGMQEVDRKPRFDRITGKLLPKSAWEPVCKAVYLHYDEVVYKCIKCGGLTSRRENKRYY